MKVVQVSASFPRRPGDSHTHGCRISTHGILLVTKSVNSSFHDSPDVDAWLRGREATGVVVFGITTNHCCGTPARVGGNLGHRVLFAHGD